MYNLFICRIVNCCIWKNNSKFVQNVFEKMTIMEKTSDLVFKYVFKRIIYFNSDHKDLIIKTLKVIKDEISTTNSCDSFECIIYKDNIEIYCNDENLIKEFEKFLICKLPDDTLVYPHFTEHPVNFDDIQRFQTFTQQPLGQCICQAIQV